MIGEVRNRGSSDSYHLVLASTTMAFFIATHTMVSLFVPLFAVALGASPATVGGLVSLSFVLPLFLAMPIGSAVDRIGSRTPITVACIMHTALPALVWAYPSLWTLALVQALGGVAHLMLIVAAQRYVSGLGRGSRAEKNFGWYSTFQSGGQMVGPLLGGLLIDVVGHGAAFLCAGALAAVGVVLSRLLKSGTGAAGAGRISPFGGPGQIKELLANPGVRMAILISCGVLVADAIRQTFLPVYLEELDFPATVIGLLISIRSLMSMAVRPFMPIIVHRLRGRALTALVMTSVLAVGLGATAFFETLIPLAFCSLLVGLGSGITQPLSIVTVTDHVPASKVGFALGLRLTGNRLAQVVSPALIGLVAEYASVSTAFIAAASTLLITQTLILRWRPRFEQAERDAALLESVGSA